MKTRGRCPVCLSNKYTHLGGGYDPPEPEESWCETCGFSHQQSGGACYFESGSVDFFFSTYSDDWRGMWSGYVRHLWLQPWVALRAWLHARRSKVTRGDRVQTTDVAKTPAPEETRS